MNRIIPIILALLLAQAAVGQGVRLGGLKSNDLVLTPAAPAVKDGYPVFVIPTVVPYTECQIRATITNFVPGFLLRADGVPIHNFIPLVDDPKVGGKWVYRALASNLTATWSVANSRWEIIIGGNTITWSGNMPWNEAGAADANTGLADWTDAGGINYTATHEPFVYRTCTTGKAAEDLVTADTWATGSGDTDPWVFFSKQDTNPADFADQFRLQKWDWNTSLTSQISTAGGVWSVGRQIIFQPSRGNLGASEWMQQNLDRLVWVYQLQMPNGDAQQQPNGTPIWTVMHPSEWRTGRINLPTTTP